jgi:prevent-host-death family protein
MSITTLSSREFNQDRSRATKAAKKGPVYITNRGRPNFVLLSVEDFNKFTHQEKTIVELLTMPDGTPEFDFDFEEQRSISQPREVNLD